MKDSSQDLEFW